MTKEASPAFQFYAADFLADENVALMDATDVGCYWLLICYCWREGSIPADDKSCARLCRVSEQEFNDRSTVVLQPFIESGTEANRLVHPRLELERQKQRERRNNASKAGKMSGESRSKSSKTTSKQGKRTTVQKPFNGSPTESNPSSSSSSSSSISSSITSNGKPKTAPAEPSVGVGPVPKTYHPEFAAAFDAYRPTARGGKNKRGAFSAWWKVIGRITEHHDDAVGWLVERITVYASSAEGKSDYAPELSRWLNEDRFDETPDVWDKCRGDPTRIVASQADIDAYAAIPVEVITDADCGDLL